MNSSMGVQGSFTHLPFTTQCQHVLLNRSHCSVRVLAATVDTLHSVTSMAYPSCIFLDCFLHVFQHKILAATFNTIYEDVVTCLSIKGLYE